MCGINGTIGRDEKTVAEMNTATIHRGPDDTGVLSLGNFTIGNNRLAVIDLSPLGHQPMLSQNGHYAIAYNGEIYNFEEIKKELESTGVQFKSHSDTEVILEGFSAWGSAITQKLRGMWALAIIDNKNNSLFLSRDPFGIKPLYVYDDGTTLAFSSEIKGLLANEKVGREINPDVVKEVIVLGYPIAPKTILKNVRALLPGEEITIDLNTKKKMSVIQKLETLDSSIPPTDEEYEKLLLDSVRHHLIADVPVGLFFSGGIDSTVLAVALNMLGHELNAYHVKVPGRDDNEYAKKIAEHLKLNFKEIDLEKENISELFEQMIEKMDQPFADASLLPTMLVSREARKDVTVVLSGEGGDELFGGYLRHNKLTGLMLDFSRLTRKTRLENMVTRAPWLLSFGAKLRGLSRYRELSNASTLYFEETAIGSLIGNTEELAQEFKKRIDIREPDQVLALDRLVYLPDDLLLKIDTATMAFSLEGRVPFLDREIFKAVANAPMSWKRGETPKAPLKRFLLKHLPKELVERPKTGFSISLGSLFTSIGPHRVNKALEWYRETYTGLLPSLDTVLTHYEKRQGVLLKQLGYSIYAIIVLHAFSEKIK